MRNSRILLPVPGDARETVATVRTRGEGFLLFGHSMEADEAVTALWEKSRNSVKRKRMRRQKSVQEFLNSKLVKAYQEYLRTYRHLGHRSKGFPSTADEIFNFGRELVDIPKQLTTWKEFSKWLPSRISQQYSRGKWLDQQDHRQFQDAWRMIVRVLVEMTEERHYDAALASALTFILCGLMPAAIATAEHDAQIAVLHHWYCVEEKKRTPQERLIRSAIQIRLEHPEMTWPESLRAANVQFEFISKTVFDKNFEAYMNALCKGIKKFTDEMSIYCENRK